MVQPNTGFCAYTGWRYEAEMPHESCAKPAEAPFRAIGAFSAVGQTKAH